MQPDEWITNKHILEQGLQCSRMLSYSKSGYLLKHPTHNTLFNANIFTAEEGKVWYGDLDLTLEGEKLQAVANIVGRTLYVLREMDGRFENENRSDAGELAFIAAEIYKPQ